MDRQRVGWHADCGSSFVDPRLIEQNIRRVTVRLRRHLRFRHLCLVVSAISSVPPQIVAQAGGGTAPSNGDLGVYEENLLPPWFHTTLNCSVDLTSTDRAYAGSASMKVRLTSAWGWVSLHYGPWNTPGIDLSAFDSVQFAVYPTSEALSLAVFFENDQGNVFPKIARGTFQANAWTLVSIPISQLNPGGRRINKVFIQDFSGVAKTYYIDDFLIAARDPSPPAAPLLFAPPDASVDIRDSVAFRWLSSDGAERYSLQVSTSTSFQFTDVDRAVIAETLSVVRGLGPGATYYWRVKAVNAGGESDWSSIWRFETAAAPPPIPEPPDLVAPYDGFDASGDTLVLSWSPSTSAETYDLQVSTASTFEPVLFQSSGIAQTSDTVGGLTAGIAYYWRVRGRNDAGTGGWSQVWAFSTAPASPAVPDIPILIEPPDGSVDADENLVLAWSMAAGAAWYRLEISRDRGFGTLVAERDTLLDTTWTVTGLPAGESLCWRVRAVNGAGNGPWSGVNSFTTKPDGGANVISLQNTFPFPARASIAEYSASDYRIVGIPGAGNRPVSELVPGRHAVDWDVYWDDGSASDYLVRYDGGPDFVFRPGRAFWMIKRSSWTISLEVPPMPVDEIGSAGIQVHRGWNTLTNPFPNPVPWGTVQALNATSELLYGFEGTGFVRADSMLPFRGYYFFHSDTVDTLRIPQAAGPSVSGGQALSSVGLEEHGWKATLVAVSPEQTDDALWFGVSPNAADGPDRNDIRKPVHRGAGLATWFDRPEWDSEFSAYAADVRSDVGRSATWKFHVSAPGGTYVTMRCPDVQNIPSAFVVTLVDLSSGIRTDLRTDANFSFLAVGGQRIFALIVGDSSSDPPEIPSADNFVVGEPFPNPFNTEVSIQLETGRRDRVRIDIMDLLGRTVDVLSEIDVGPGVYALRWNATRVPSGVYYVRVRGSEGGLVIRKVVLAR